MVKASFLALPLCGAGLLVLVAVGLAGCSGSSSGSSSGGEATLTGFAVDAGSRAALAGAVAEAQGHSATADNGGFFTLAGLTSGTVSLTVSAAGHQTTTVSVSLPGGGLALGQVPLPPLHVAGDGDVSGQVTLSGVGVADARVVVGSVQSLTDASGNFTLYNVPAGPETLTAADSGGISVGVLTVVVPADGHLTGVVIALSGGPPPPPGI
jgi:hypothetical protein